MNINTIKENLSAFNHKANKAVWHFFTTRKLILALIATASFMTLHSFKLITETQALMGCILMTPIILMGFLTLWNGDIFGDNSKINQTPVKT